jgi:hypothetical protein
MAMIDDQLERCKVAVIRLEQALPEDYTGETKVEIAAHEIDDFDVFLQNAGNMINIARNLGEIRVTLLERLERAESFLQLYPEPWAAYKALPEQQSLVRFVATKHGCDESQARRLIVEGRVEVNMKKVEETDHRLNSGDLVEVFNETRQICSPHRVD